VPTLSFSLSFPSLHAPLSTACTSSAPAPFFASHTPCHIWTHPLPSTSVTLSRGPNNSTERPPSPPFLFSANPASPNCPLPSSHSGDAILPATSTSGRSSPPDFSQVPPPVPFLGECCPPHNSSSIGQRVTSQSFSQCCRGCPKLPSDTIGARCHRSTATPSHFLVPHHGHAVMLIPHL
jgi:hypothetical protein